MLHAIRSIALLSTLLLAAPTLARDRGDAASADGERSGDDSTDPAPERAAPLSDPDEPDPEEEPDEKPVELTFKFWIQPWVRYQRLNPGTTVRGEPAEQSFDVGLRRVRMVAVGEFGERFLRLPPYRNNNQTFASDLEKQPIFVHGASGQVDILEEYLTIGAGLHYWHGISRMTNISTGSLLAIDAPILNWPTLERADQFARYPGTSPRARSARSTIAWR